MKTKVALNNRSSPSNDGIGAKKWIKEILPNNISVAQNCSFLFWGVESTSMS